MKKKSEPTIFLEFTCGTVCTCGGKGYRLDMINRRKNYVCTLTNAPLQHFFILCKQCGAKRIFKNKTTRIILCDVCQKKKNKQAEEKFRKSVKKEVSNKSNTLLEIEMLKLWSNEKVKKYFDTIKLRSNWEDLNKEKIVQYCTDRLSVYKQL